MLRFGILLLAAAMACGTSTARSAPSVPKSVSAAGGKHHVALSWTASSGAASYDVVRDGQVVATTATPAYDDVGLAAGTTYTYAVAAANALGTSPRSGAVTAITIPDAPAQLTASSLAAGVSLSWTASSGATFYDVLSGPSPQGSFTRFATVTGTTATQAPPSWVSVTYVVRATNASGASDDSPSTSARWAAIDARDGDREATLSWPPAPAASSYRVMRSSTAGGPYTVAGTTTGTTFTDAIANGAPLFYVIDAVAAELIRSPEVRVLALPVCVANLATNTVQVYRRGHSESEPPLREFGDRTGLIMSLGVAVDSTHGEIWAVVQAGPREATLAFARTETGNVAPIHRSPLAGRAVVVDPDQGRVVVAEFGFLRIFNRTATQIGFVTAAGLQTATSAAIDRTRHELWVVDSGVPASARVYALSDVYSGRPDIAPLRTIFGTASLLDQGPDGIAIDETNGEIAVALPSASSVVVFDAAASGAVAPKRTLTGLVSPRGVAIDPVHDELWVAGPSALSVFARTAAGPSSPIRTIAGPTTLLDDAGAIALDLADGEVTVANRTWGAGLTTYARTASGDAVPARTLSGRSAGVNLPIAIAADPVSGEIFVGNSDAVNVYGHDASGATVPLRTLDVAASRLVFDSAHDELYVVSRGGLLVYPRTATGAASPARSLPTPAAVQGLLVVGDEVFVTDGFSSVFVLGRDGTPLRGFSTGFALRSLAYDSVTDEVGVFGRGLDPFGVTFYSRAGAPTGRAINLEHFGPFGVSLLLDSVTGETWALIAEPEAQNPVAGRIAIYSRDPGLSTAPVRTIDGSATGMVEPFAIAFCP